MESYLLDESERCVCSNAPDCSGFAIEAGVFRLKGYEGPTLECGKCGAQMQLKSGRFLRKVFWLHGVQNTRKLLRSGQPAPPKMTPIPMPELQCLKVDDTYVLRDGAAGLFWLRAAFLRIVKPERLGRS